jgi:hypothetical protein
MSPAISGDDASLTANSCTSTTFCMAGGFYTVRGGAQWPGVAESWDGASWTAQAPLPQRSYRGGVSYPLEMSCGTSSACMLVGEHYNTVSKAAMLAELWNGSAWDVVRWYNPSGMAQGSLDDVSCTGADYCMIVGEQARKKTDRSFAAQWTGSGALKTVKVPAPAHATAADLADVSLHLGHELRRRRRVLERQQPGAGLRREVERDQLEADEGAQHRGQEADHLRVRVLCWPGHLHGRRLPQ